MTTLSHRLTYLEYGEERVCVRARVCVYVCVRGCVVLSSLRLAQVPMACSETRVCESLRTFVRAWWEECVGVCVEGGLAAIYHRPLGGA